MRHIKVKVLSLLKTKAALVALGELDVDVSDDLKECEAEISRYVARLKLVAPIAYYRRRKRWRTGLTTKQKDTIRGLIKDKSDDYIVEELVA